MQLQLQLLLCRHVTTTTVRNGGESTGANYDTNTYGRITRDHSSSDCSWTVVLASRPVEPVHFDLGPATPVTLALVESVAVILC